MISTRQQVHALPSLQPQVQHFEHEQVLTVVDTAGSTCCGFAAFSPGFGSPTGKGLDGCDRANSINADANIS
jgi:hypothetical protein